MNAGNATRAYGDPNPAFAGSIVGLKNGDTITATYASTATRPVRWGLIPCMRRLDPTTKLGNYTVTNNDGTLTVTQAALTVTAANASRLYGDANPAFTGTIIGLKNGDNITASFASPATAASAAGTYAIVPSLADPTLKLGNYAVTL